MVALRLLGLGQHVEPVGGSELDSDKRVLLQEVHKQCGFDGCLDTFGMNAVKRDPESHLRISTSQVFRVQVSAH